MRACFSGMVAADEGAHTCTQLGADMDGGDWVAGARELMSPVRALLN